MVSPKIEEVSGVDLPAHLVPGWMIMKSANAANAVLAAALNDKGNEMPEATSFDKSVLSADAAAAFEALEARLAKAEADAQATVTIEADPEAVFAKSLEALPESLREHFLKSQRQAAENDKMLKGLREEREIARYAEMAKSLTHLPKVDTKFGETLRKAADGDADAFSAMYEVMKASDAVIKEGNLFSEIGIDSGGDGARTAMQEVEAAAAEQMKIDPKLTKAQAMTKAVTENPALYARAQKEA